MYLSYTPLLYAESTCIGVKDYFGRVEMGKKE